MKRSRIVEFDRLGICDWLSNLLTHATVDDASRQAIYSAISIVSAPALFSDRHYVSIIFRSHWDQSDVGGKVYSEHVCRFRFSRNRVTVSWSVDECDDYSQASVHKRSRRIYDGNSGVSFLQFVEGVERNVAIGDLASHSYMIGGARISSSFGMPE